jgi:DNA-binding NarL/FixJ family response regulator
MDAPGEAVLARRRDASPPAPNRPLDPSIIENLRRHRSPQALVIGTYERFAASIRDCLGALRPAVDTSWSATLAGGLARLAHAEVDFVFLGHVADGGTAVEDAFSVRMANCRARSAVRSSRIVITRDDMGTEPARWLGACFATGYVPASLAPERLAAALRWTCAGGIHLPGIGAPEHSAGGVPRRDLMQWLKASPLTCVYLSLFLQGLTQSEIASICGVNRIVPRKHVERVMRSLGMTTWGRMLELLARERVSIVWPDLTRGVAPE